MTGGTIGDRQFPRPVMLIVRDGWGCNPHPEWNHANAVHLARKPVDDHLMRTYPHVLIRTCGNDVGLPQGVSGNSEVGHQNIGAGRIVEQEIMRITGRIRDGSFFSNPVLAGAYDAATARTVIGAAQEDYRSRFGDLDAQLAEAMGPGRR